MTIVPPKFTFYDRILRKMGEKRGMIIPRTKGFGVDIYAYAGKESFLKAFLRPRNKELPEGMVDFIDYYTNARKEFSNSSTELKK